MDEKWGIQVASSAWSFWEMGGGVGRGGETRVVQWDWVGGVSPWVLFCWVIGWHVCMCGVCVSDQVWIHLRGA